jgi:4-diphosphocytidyl-2-C-methyl-D-erythritol kinase
VGEVGGPGFAPAKVNLALHVTGQRADGYHLLDSLVVFAGVGDSLTAVADSELVLGVDGPRAEGVPVDGRNLVLRAARMLAEGHGARLTLTKRLPHAAGIGGGSSDAAAALRVLADLWGVALPGADDPAVLALGADVPVCLAAPRPMRMRGIGERLAEVPRLPDAALVLVNPGVEVPTPAVFRALAVRENAPMPDVPAGMDFAAFVGWLRTTRNDLQGPAETVSPLVTEALEALRGQADLAHAVMSGSGATCVGIARDLAGAERAAAVIARARPGWWVVAARMLS